MREPIRLELRRPDGRAESVLLDPIAPALPDVPGLTQLAVHDQGLLLSTVHGTALLVWGAHTNVEGFELALGPKPVDDAATGAKGTSPIVMIGAVAIAGVVLWMLGEDTPVDGLGDVPEPPALLDGPQGCAAGNSPTASRAERDLAHGRAKRQRLHFELADGVEAVAHFDRAAACFRDAGRLEEAAVAAREGAALRARLEQDYRVRRFRLQRAIEHERWPDAIREAEGLLALLRHREGRYVSWLGDLTRVLRQRTGGTT